MATHRRTFDGPPAELIDFRADDWASPDDGPGSALGAWRTAFDRWRAARIAWAADHADSGLDRPLDLLRAEVQAMQQRRRLQPTAEPDDDGKTPDGRPSPDETGRTW